MNKESRGGNSELIKCDLNYWVVRRMAKSYRVSGDELGSLETEREVIHQTEGLARTDRPAVLAKGKVLQDLRAISLG